MKRFIFILLVAMLGFSAQAAQIGDSVQSIISLNDRINIPRNVAVEVTHIDLEDGVWDVSGQVQVVESFMTQAAIVGGSINTSVALSIDGTQLFLSCTVPQYFVGLSMPSRAIEVNGTTRFFLVVYNQSQQVTLVPQAWGFISARKIRNNH